MTDSQRQTATARTDTGKSGRTGRRAATVGVLVVLCLSTALTGAGLAVQTTDTTQTATTSDTAEFVVGVGADGDATVAVSYTFDLDDDARQAAFEQLRENDSAREAFKKDFEQQLADVAAEAGAAAGREMSVTDTTLGFETADDTGIATLSVTWTDLAAVEEDRLVVTEPFASGFETDRPLHVVAPDGYSVTDASPAPDSPTDETASWAAGSDLTGFEVVVSDDAEKTGSDSDTADETTGDTEESETGTDEDAAGDTTTENTETEATTDGNGAGFGALAVVAGLAAIGLFVLGRRVHR